MSLHKYNQERCAKLAQFFFSGTIVFVFAIAHATKAVETPNMNVVAKRDGGQHRAWTHRVAQEQSCPNYLQRLIEPLRLGVFRAIGPIASHCSLQKKTVNGCQKEKKQNPKFNRNLFVFGFKVKLCNNKDSFACKGSFFLGQKKKEEEREKNEKNKSIAAIYIFFIDSCLKFFLKKTMSKSADNTPSLIRKAEIGTTGVSFILDFFFSVLKKLFPASFGCH